MRSEGPKYGRREKESKSRDFGEEVFEAKGEWVETDELKVHETTVVLLAIGRIVAEVVYREGTAFGRMRRDDE